MHMMYACVYDKWMCMIHAREFVNVRDTWIWMSEWMSEWVSEWVSVCDVHVACELMRVFVCVWCMHACVYDKWMCVMCEHDVFMNAN